MSTKEWVYDGADTCDDFSQDPTQMATEPEVEVEDSTKTFTPFGRTADVLNLTKEDAAKLSMEFPYKQIFDKDGVALTKEEAEEYTNDLFDGGIPMSEDYMERVMIPKWGKRLGIQ
jgi:hypothetical protein